MNTNNTKKYYVSENLSILSKILRAHRKIREGGKKKGKKKKEEKKQ